MKEYVIFSVENQNFALNIDYVNSVVAAAALSPVQAETDQLLGLLNFHGSMIPVLNIRKNLYFESRCILSSDQLIICKKDDMTSAIHVDKVLCLKSLNIETPSQQNPISPLIQTVIEDQGQVISILCIKTLFSHLQGGISC